MAAAPSMAIFWPSASRSSTVLDAAEPNSRRGQQRTRAHWAGGVIQLVGGSCHRARLHPDTDQPRRRLYPRVDAGDHLGDTAQIQRELERRHDHGGDRKYPSTASPAQGGYGVAAGVSPRHCPGVSGSKWAEVYGRLVTWMPPLS